MIDRDEVYVELLRILDENPMETVDIDAAIRAAMELYPVKVLEYRAGDKGLLGFFVGKVMKATKGKANPQEAIELTLARAMKKLISCLIVYATASIEEHNRLNASYGTIIAKVREALAELDKPAEPVAWMVKTRIGVEWVTTLGVTETGARQIAIERYRNGSDVQHMNPIPLYTHPPQAQQPGKVLTEEEIELVADEEGYALLTPEAVRRLGTDSSDRRNRNRVAFTHGLRVARSRYLAPAAGLTVDEVMGCLPGATERGQLNETRFRENLTAAIQAKS